jgi:hypothetical protein
VSHGRYGAHYSNFPNNRPGPLLIKSAKAGTFDPAAATAASEVANARSFKETVDVLASQGHDYAELLNDWTDTDLLTEVEIFGQKTTRGAFLVKLAIGGHAAYHVNRCCSGSFGVRALTLHSFYTVTCSAYGLRWRGRRDSVTNATDGDRSSGSNDSFVS